MSIRESVMVVQGEPVPRQQARTITAWLHENEAIQLLLGGRALPRERTSRRSERRFRLE